MQVLFSVYSHTKLMSSKSYVQGVHIELLYFYMQVWIDLKSHHWMLNGKSGKARYSRHMKSVPCTDITVVHGVCYMFCKENGCPEFENTVVLDQYTPPVP